MAVRYFALILGILFLLIGVMGFIPGLVTQPAGARMHDLAIDANHGYLLGIFPVNAAHNLVHIVSGLAGIFCYRTFGASRIYARVLAVVYGLVTVMGLLPPPFNTTFGLMPIHGNNIWLHGFIAVAAAYFGFAPAYETTTEVSAADTPRI